MGEPPLREKHGLGDRRSILSCIDGLLNCGGATARIAIGDQTVVWEDFRDVPSGEPVDLGPFVFDRRHYKRALARWRVRRGNPRSHGQAEAQPPGPEPKIGLA